MIEPDEKQKLQAEIERLKQWNRHFFDRVRYMRECQKEYFKTRSQDALHKSTAVEREVDGIIMKLMQGLQARETAEKIEHGKQLIMDLCDAVEAK